MHAPDGFLNAGTAVVTAGISLATVSAALRQARGRLEESQAPLAGIAAAFVFAAQMINFPVVAGTSGHLLGGALAAVLLGPSLGLVVVTVVVAVQAFVFADGGLTALGYNVLNMAVVTSLGGYALFRGIRRLLPATPRGVAVAAGIAAGLSVPLSAAAFSIEWLFGATAPVAFDTVFGAMVGVHLFIGVGEGVITAMVVGAVLSSRADLVHGAWDLPRLSSEVPGSVRRRGVLIAGALVSLVLAAVVSQFASQAPDGLERVAGDVGITQDPTPSAADALFADYALDGIDDERVSLAVAGLAGVVITAAVGAGLLAAGRDRRRQDEPSAARS